jgi:type I restriction enzyme S subunit
VSKEVLLGSIADLKTGPFGTQLHADEYVSEGVPVINVRNIGYGNILADDIDMVSEETVSRLSEHKLCENDIVFGRKGSIDRHAFIDKRYDGWMQGSDCIRVRIQNSDVNPRYVSHYLKLDSVKKQLINGAVGSTMPSMNSDVLKSISVLLPDKSVQDVVEGILSGIEEKIENNNTICSNLEAMAKLLYDYWFVQFDFPVENGKPYKSSGGKMVWNEELKREIPAGWEVGRIGDMITTERGISYSTPNIMTGNGVPMLNLATFMPGGGSYKADGLKHFLGDYPKNKVLKPFELIMCNTQQTAIKFETDIIGRAMLVPDIFAGDVVFSHHVNVIRTSVENMKYYLLFLFNSDYYHKYISGFTNGTNILGLSFNGVEDYLVEIPSTEVLKAFGERILGIERKKSEIILENQQLASLRDFLLPMLMNGQVKVTPQNKEA